MPRKQHNRTLTRIRQWDDALDERDDLDDLAQEERIRKQPRAYQPPTSVKQVRRQREKTLSRDINRFMRKYRQNNDKP
ncbi:MAG: hypothetical protein ACLFVO_06200 [Chloroflexaceae bacterium]|jgi:hypothetical protein